MGAKCGPDHAEIGDSDAQFRHRADAVRQAVSRWGRGAYRAADWSEGHEPGHRRCAGAGTGPGGLLRVGRDYIARSLLGDLPATYLEGAALLLVDDFDAASISRCQ